MIVTGADGINHTIKPGANLADANLAGADLAGADLREANLTFADFESANLTESNLAGANLMGADLRAANLMNVDLNGALYTDETVFPKGLEPGNLGMCEIGSNVNLAGTDSRRHKIKKFCKQRKIVSLFHFTQTDNLASILKLGLISRAKLSEESILYKYTDAERWDRHTEASCVTISWPQYKMFYTKAKENYSSWCVLQISASVLWELSCAFYPDNAARSNLSGDSDKRDPEDLEKMFHDDPQNMRDNLDIPCNYPTNPQAEVLVFDTISPSNLEKVYFDSGSSLGDFCRKNSGYQDKVFQDREYFGSRKDWDFWISDSFPNKDQSHSATSDVDNETSDDIPF